MRLSRNWRDFLFLSDLGFLVNFLSLRQFILNSVVKASTAHSRPQAAFNAEQIVSCRGLSTRWSAKIQYPTPDQLDPTLLYNPFLSDQSSLNSLKSIGKFGNQTN
jgi:hypothetical protein